MPRVIIVQFCTFVSLRLFVAIFMLSIYLLISLSPYHEKSYTIYVVSFRSARNAAPLDCTQHN